MAPSPRRRARSATASDIAPRDLPPRARDTRAESAREQPRQSGLAGGLPSAACGPYVFSPDAFDIVADAFGRHRSIAQGTFPMRLEAIVAFRSPTPLRRWIRKPGSNETFVFQAIERGVDGAERDRPRRDELFDPVVDGDAV